MFILHARAHRSIPNAEVVPVADAERRSVLRAASSMLRLRWVYGGAALIWGLALIASVIRHGLAAFDSPRTWAGVGVVALASVGTLSLQLAAGKFRGGAPRRDEQLLGSGLEQLYIHRVFALSALVVVALLTTARATGWSS